MVNWRVKLSLLLTYFVFAILLNSVGTVILQVINNYQVSKEAASVLEGFKDLPIAVVSFLVASWLPHFGYKKAMISGLVLVTLACLAQPLFPAFLTTKILFLCVGIAFALIKVSVYSTVGLVTECRESHASFMNFLEGIFMVGVLSGYWLFAYFIDTDNAHSTAWVDVYWLLSALCCFNILVLMTTQFAEPKIAETQISVAEEFVTMLGLMLKPLVFVFVLSAFCYVLIEQGIGTWLPTFNNEVLKLPMSMSIQITSIFAASLAIGRLSAGAVLQRVSWYPFINFCLIAMAILVTLTLPLTKNIVQDNNINWSSVPAAAFIFPLIGLFMAPIYPAINSAVLTALPKQLHSSMTGLIVLFSALGGTTGSIITGFTFSRFDGQTAFYLSLIPIGIMLITLFKFNRESLKRTPNLSLRANDAT